MSLDHILLGVLETPQSGYDLKRWFDEVFAYFWNADQSQIYRAVGRLNEQGLIRSKVVPSAVGPMRRLYRTTAKGRAELKRWLREGPVSPAQRSQVYAQLLYLARLPDAEAAEFLARMKAQADELVGALEAVARDAARDEPSTSTEGRDRTAFFSRASLELGLARARATQDVVASLVEAHRRAFPLTRGVVDEHVA